MKTVALGIIVLIVWLAIYLIDRRKFKRDDYHIPEDEPWWPHT